MTNSDIIKAAEARRDREWEAALADAFNRFDVDPARPPLDPYGVSVWAARIVERIRLDTGESMRGILEQAIDDWCEFERGER